MNFKNMTALASLGLTGLLSGCADTMKRPATPPVMTINKPNTAPTTAMSPAMAAVNSPAFRNVQTPTANAMGAQLLPAPSNGQAVVSSSPVTNPAAYGLPTMPQNNMMAQQAPPAYAPQVQQVSVPPSQYQQPMMPTPYANMAPQQAPMMAAPAYSQHNMQPPQQMPAMQSVPTMMPPATPIAHSVPMLPSAPVANVAPTAVPMLPPMPTSAPAYPTPAPIMAMPKPVEQPATMATTLPDLDPAVMMPPVGNAPATTPNVMPARATAPVPTTPAPNGPPSNFSELPATQLFPVPETRR